jgi:hypothetical protein
MSKKNKIIKGDVKLKVNRTQMYGSILSISATFENGEDLDDVLSELKTREDAYGFVSVATLHKLCGVRVPPEMIPMWGDPARLSQEELVLEKIVSW